MPKLWTREEMEATLKHYLEVGCNDSWNGTNNVSNGPHFIALCDIQPGEELTKLYGVPKWGINAALHLVRHHMSDQPAAECGLRLWSEVLAKHGYNLEFNSTGGPDPAHVNKLTQLATAVLGPPGV